MGVAASSLQDPKWQCVDKNNCTLPVRDGKEGERTGKSLRSLGGCNFRQGNYLRFCRESESQGVGLRVTMSLYYG